MDPLGHPLVFLSLFWFSSAEARKRDLGDDADLCFARSPLSGLAGEVFIPSRL